MADRLAGSVDLEVAEPEVPVGKEGLRAGALDVGEGEIGPLGVVDGRDRSVRVEGVADVDRDGVPFPPVSEGHLGSSGVDLAEVDHDRAVRQRAHRARRDRVLGDPGALRVEAGERCGAGRSAHRRRRPGRVVEARRRPAGRVEPRVDPLDEVAAVVVALRGGEPLGLARPPRAVGGNDHHPAAAVVHGDLDQEARGRRGPATSGPVPVVEHPERVGPARVHHPGEVGRLVVLLVGEAEARPRVDLGSVDPQLVAVGGRHVRGGPFDGPPW